MGVIQKNNNNNKYRLSIAFTSLAKLIGVCCYMIISSSRDFIPVAIDLSYLSWGHDREKGENVTL